MQLITNYKDKEKWNKFIIKNSYPTAFLQSWEWGEFNQQILKTPIQRWAIVDSSNQLKLVLNLIKKPLALGKFFWYCPRGPIVLNNDKELPSILSYLSKKIKLQVKSKIFIRFTPTLIKATEKSTMFKINGWQKPKILIHLQEPEQTLILDLKQSLDTLLATMRQKTRYNIRLAEKKGVKIIKLKQPTQNDILNFIRLMQLTGQRNKIKIHTANYYTQLIKYFSQLEQPLQLKLYQARYQNKILAAALLIYFGQTATYLHGASSNEHRQLMPNHLLQWQMIQDAQEAGYEWYDFWGISQTNPHWAGISRFKRGFGGKIVSLTSSWDYVVDKNWYNLFKLLKLVKKIIPKFISNS